LALSDHPKDLFHPLALGHDGFRRRGQCLFHCQPPALFQHTLECLDGVVSKQLCRRAQLWVNAGSVSDVGQQEGGVFEVSELLSAHAPKLVQFVQAPGVQRQLDLTAAHPAGEVALG